MGFAAEPDTSRRGLGSRCTGRRIPVRSVDVVAAEEGRGLVRDRYHGTSYRHVTIQSQELLDLAAKDLGRDFDTGATRRNITVDAGDIPTKLGTPIRIGAVELQVVRIMPPCRLLDDDIGRRAMVGSQGRGGSVCRVLTSGAIRVGDSVTIGTPPSVEFHAKSKNTSR